MTCRDCKTDYRQFRHSFTLEELRGTAGDAGHVDPTDDANWISRGSFKLKFLSESSKEFYRAQQTQANITHVAEVRYTNTTKNITPAHRWRKGTRKIEITGAHDPAEEHQVIRMTLVERK